jgi:hypothetical protein
MSGTIEVKDLSVIRAAWERVFSCNNTFVWPFKPQFATGRIFYPTDGYHLTIEQFLAVGHALARVGETGFFVSIVESEGLTFLDRSFGHWVFENPTYEGYCQLPLALENAIYSREGRWGILISHEMHAVVAGSTEFMAALACQYGEWAHDLRLLQEAWSGNANAGWLELVMSRATPVS